MFQILDYVGTLVFAISGALAAMNRKFDPFGVAILALVTSVGGGSLRDMLIGRGPVGWMQDINYFYIILAGAVIAMAFRPHLVIFRRTMFLFDAIGLALFTITGVEIGLQAGIHPVICLLLGTMSAAFGGVIRDILCGKVPLIFHQEIYASLSLLGGALFLLMRDSGLLPTDLVYSLICVIVVVLRILAVKRKWVMPRGYREH
ncbi:hypothetical protein CEQ90_01595 [Lewinellaceae bacterium SD302]|nr:hypothetical protein CEQ90_01595 [Lewinellaceae bacterium SD302]